MEYQQRAVHSFRERHHKVALTEKWYLLVASRTAATSFVCRKALQKFAYNLIGNYEFVRLYVPTSIYSWAHS